VARQGQQTVHQLRTHLNHPFLFVFPLHVFIVNHPFYKWKQVAAMNPENNSNAALPVKRIGLVVNPIAGMGGSVGLKGTDGADTLAKAVSLGSKPIAHVRAEQFLSELSPAKEKVQLYVGAGAMGEEEAETCGYKFTVLGEGKAQTSSEDTKKTVELIRESRVDLLVICGGDGTARDVCGAIDMKIPVLGVPTGVKMHSAIFAVTPIAAARVAIRFLWADLPLREAEVMDVDESAFREGHVSAKLYGFVLTPYEPHLIQANKLASPMTEDEVRNQAAIAIYIIETMQPHIIYIVGPGTTTRTIGDLLDQKKTLLGVDLFLDKKIVAADVTEQQILEKTAGKAARIIVTPIGGQGFIFGRGNQQISAQVIRRVGLDNITVVATESKLRSLSSLRVDTGDPALDEALRKHEFRVVSDYKTERPMRVE
jgi:predicted polyphosphate/ATP-dependent NAD kinase